MTRERTPDALMAAFRKRLSTEVYAEGDSALHTELTALLLPKILDAFPVAEGARVLDVGCGAGVALAHFEARGLRATGITLSEQDRDACVSRGYDCLLMDQSFLEFDSKSFGFIWCRHAIEHSPWPYLTLLELNRVTADGGYVYVEVPRPDDPRCHEANTNHYSVLGRVMWEALFQRAGFRCVHRDHVSVPLSDEVTGNEWTETYLFWVLQKSTHEALEVDR